MSTLIFFLIFLAAAYALLLIVVFAFQSRLIFFPNVPARALGPGPESIGLRHQRVEFTAEDGIRLQGWFVPAAAPRGVILFCHGNAGNISHRLDSLRIFHDLGFSTLIFDYRGYGESRGRVSEHGTYLDAEAAWNYLTAELGFGGSAIVLFGRSLGAAIAARLASRKNPSALIVESGFVSVPDLAARLYPWIPARFLARIRYPTGEYLKAVSCPVLIVHSRDDEIIPFSQAMALFQMARDRKCFLELRGGHNDGFIVSGRNYRDGLDRFLADIVQP